MDRFSLTDAEWEKMEPFCLGKGVGAWIGR